MKLFFKTISYSITHVSVAIAVSYAITRDLKMSLGIGLIEPIIQTIVFALHEYLWEYNNGISSKSIIAKAYKDRINK